MRVHRDWVLTPERAAFHEPTATAVIADVHLGYNQARCRSGEAVPFVTVAEALAPLRRVVERLAVRRLVIAGDLFEEGWSASVVEELTRWLDEAQVELVAVTPGNHDRGLRAGLSHLPVFADGFDLAGWHVSHGDGTLPDAPVVHGHVHPWFRLGPISAPCYLVSERAIVLPAFSLDAVGGNVVGKRQWRNHRCCAIAEGEVLDLGPLDRLNARLRT